MIAVLRSVVPCLLLVGQAVSPVPARIVIDYPEPESVFPPEITPPTFVWRDGAAGSWRIVISFPRGAPPIRVISRGRPFRLGRIDPDCVSETNELPRPTRQQAGARTWAPDPALWETIKKRSTPGPATVTITGLNGANEVSRGRVTIRTSTDPVGSPIFYRDVPLMPSETQTGVIKPLSAAAVKLVQWRLRDIGEPRSRVVMDNLPVCANCHSFSADGKTMGMDLDGLQNNRGLYTLTPLKPETSIGDENLVQWRSPAGRLKGGLRVGFMSQVSPDGRYVVTTTNPSEPSNYFVVNFKDYRFLQVFYPTRGVLSWYSRQTGVLQPLPGADDPRFVQTNAVWSPDGRSLVFARAAAQDPNPPGAPVPKFANDPEERQVRYDLYRIPFNAGKGGVAERIEGASENGMSNTFPKVSPDGRWIVFVQCRNGLLMRPDSRLYIVPFAGGQARPMRCNTRRMNSWHSFSPNGRWLVFSSKSRSPYTEMYLTHLDAAGNDSPAILIENSTAANRAVNLPEFVNIPPGGLRKIGGPALEYYRLFDRALYLQKQRRLEESAAEWRKVLEIRPEDALANDNLGAVLLLSGRPGEAAPRLRKATEIKLRGVLETNPASAEAHERLGRILLETGRVDEAIAQFELALAPQAVRVAGGGDTAVLDTLAAAYAEAGRYAEAAAAARRALALGAGTLPPAQADALRNRIRRYEAATR